MANSEYQQISLGLQDEEELEGLVDSIIFASDDGQFAVFRLRPTHQNSRVNVTVGCEPPLVGQQIHLMGNWITLPRFGQQFKASSMRLEAPPSVEGIERFLGSGVIEGVGPAMAKRIVAKFGADTLDIIEKKPHQLELVEGIGPHVFHGQPLHIQLFFQHFADTVPVYLQKLCRLFHQGTLGNTTMSIQRNLLQGVINASSHPVLIIPCHSQAGRNGIRRGKTNAFDFLGQLIGMTLQHIQRKGTVFLINTRRKGT